MVGFASEELFILFLISSPLLLLHNWNPCSFSLLSTLDIHFWRSKWRKDGESDPCFLNLWSLLIESQASRWCSDKEPACQRRRHKRHRFNPWVRKIPAVGNSNPLQDSCLGKPMGRGKPMVGYRPWGHKELDTAEPRHTHTHTHTHTYSLSLSLSLLSLSLWKVGRILLLGRAPSTSWVIKLFSKQNGRCEAPVPGLHQLLEDLSCLGIILPSQLFLLSPVVISNLGGSRSFKTFHHLSRDQWGGTEDFGSGPGYFEETRG